VREGELAYRHLASLRRAVVGIRRRSAVRLAFAVHGDAVYRNRCDWHMTSLGASKRATKVLRRNGGFNLESQTEALALVELGRRVLGRVGALSVQIAKSRQGRGASRPLDGVGGPKRCYASSPRPWADFDGERLCGDSLSRATQVDLLVSCSSGIFDWRSTPGTWYVLGGREGDPRLA